MSKKIRTNKNNSHKRKRRTFSNVRLWSWESMIEEGGVTVSHGEVRLGHVWKELGQTEVSEVIAIPRNWSICCRVLCRIDEPEEIWIETSLKSMKDVKVSDLDHMYAEMRKDLMKALEEDDLLKHVIDCGWILKSFSTKDPIDRGYESEHLRPITKNRHLLWIESQKESSIDQ